MQKEEIIKKVNSLLIEEIEIDEKLIRPDATLKDIGIDSLDFVDIVVIVEKNFGFKVKGEEMIEIKTLNDFYNYVQKHAVDK
jgi:acyl carrier protein